MFQSLIDNFVFLMPGFVMAGVFYGLTSNPKPSQFERVVQALVFTFIIHVLVTMVAEWMGETLVAKWLGDAFGEPLIAFVLALSFGTGWAFLNNSDYLRKKFTGIGASTLMPYPSEWRKILSRKVTYVTLHLNDGRRLYGWPKEWPGDSDLGHFYIMQPAWLQTDKPPIELAAVDGILVNTRDVCWIEFVKLEEKTDDRSKESSTKT